jgi:PKHD-type hydroxylase
MIRFNNFQYLVHLENVLTDEDIQKIEDAASEFEVMEGTVIGNLDNGEKPEGRKSNISWIAPNNNTSWLYQKIHSTVLSINKQYYHFDIEGIEAIQYTTYDAPDGAYNMHIDYNPNSIVHRKISLTIQLSDDNSYEGGDLIVYPSSFDMPFKSLRKKGSMTSFLSHMIHEVTPVTKGTRKSLVVWVGGPPLK